MILVTWWRLFRKPIRANKENVTSYILAGFALQNYLQQTENASYSPQDYVDSEANAEFRHGDWRCIVRDDAGCFMCITKYQDLDTRKMP